MANDSNLTSTPPSTSVPPPALTSPASASTTAPASASPASATTPSKDPLAVLEELLAKQKASGDGTNQTTNPGGGEVAAADGPTPEEQKAAQQAEFQRLEQEAAARDAAMLQAQTEKFEAVKASPQYQARIAQEKVIKDEKHQHQADNEGFEIVQLETKKIDVPVSASSDQAV